MKLHCLSAAITALLLTVSASAASAAPVCTLLTDVATGKSLSETGDCDRPNSPASTFKIALNLMGFDSGILTDAKTPTWPYDPSYQTSMEVWKVPTDPTYWLAKSVVWYSQRLTQRLGMETFATYIQRFHYGNQDLSGDPGKNNGLTHAWLSSSLRISPSEQASFLRKILTRQLQISTQAIDLTEQIMPVTELANGWRLHGKTGTGNAARSDGSLDRDRQFGWFVGWVEKGNRRIVFVHLLQDEKKETVAGGLRARDAVIGMLPAMLDKL